MAIYGHYSVQIKTCRVFTPYLFTKGRWRSLILKFQLIFSKSTIFGWSAAVCEWNAAVIIFYIIDDHVWSLQCSIKIHAEFLHHIYLLKEDGGLSFQSFNWYFQKVPFLDEVLLCVEWNAAVIIFYIIDGHVWSLQCSIMIHAEFLHHIYLLKVDGGLSF